MLDVLRHDDSPALLKGLPPDTIAVQRERLKGGKTGDDSHRNFSEIWETGRPWLDFRKVKKTDLDPEGNSVRATARGRSWSPSRIMRVRKHTRKRKICR